MKFWIYWGATALMFCVVNGNVARKEAIIRDGQTMLLPLGPRDPRSLLQGDYMALRLQTWNQQLGPGLDEARGEPRGGCLVARFDEHGLPTFLRVHRGERLAADERLVQFRRGGLNGLRIGADSFFFQEGHAHIYEPARFGMFKVAADGEVVLVGLCDAKHQPLVPP